MLALRTRIHIFLLSRFLENLKPKFHPCGSRRGHELRDPVALITALAQGITIHYQGSSNPIVVAK